MRKRRGAVPTEAARRWQERRATIGRTVRSMRMLRGWTQADLGERSGMGRMMVSRIEGGMSAIDADVLERLGVAFGVPVLLGFGRDPMEDVADAGHLAIQELALRLARAAGFTAQFELATRPQTPRHSIDVAVADDRRRIAIVIECWNTFGDIGAAARSTARKVAELEALVARWGEDIAVSSVWIVRDTARNRELIARYPEVFRSRFPGSSVAWVAALTAGGPIPTDAGLVWCDLRATRIFARRAVPSSAAA
jgi:transcriptional regulator with XRE-family HTH domain